MHCAPVENTSLRERLRTNLFILLVRHWISALTTPQARVLTLRTTIRKAVGLEQPKEQGVVVLSQRQHDLYRSVAEHCEHAQVALAGALGPAVAASEIVYMPLNDWES